MSLHESADSMIVYGVFTARAKELLQYLSVAGASNADFHLKNYVLSWKVVQRRIYIQSLRDANAKGDSD